MKTKLSLSIILFCFIVLHHLTVFAIDELALYGVVQQIDKEKNTVTVNVGSASCPGTQIFKIASPKIRAKLDVDEKIYFRIDSNTCSSTGIHKIIKITGE